MEKFIHRQNRERYRRLLQTETDVAQRQTIMRLLAEEEAEEARQYQPRGEANPGEP